jgi:hypothetical protein
MRRAGGFAPGALLAAAVACCTAVACTTYQDDLLRGQKAFEQNEYERTLAIFRQMEPDLGQLAQDDRARYAYLRGMTDYRIGYRADARHWLSIARSIDEQLPQALPPSWKQRMVDALGEMNETVYTTGYQALTNSENPEKAKGIDENSVPLAEAGSGAQTDADTASTASDAGAATSTRDGS